MTRFRDISIGTRFDWVSEHLTWNSFYDKCVKISARKYRNDAGRVFVVGSVHARVFNIEEPAK